MLSHPVPYTVRTSSTNCSDPSIDSPWCRCISDSVYFMASLTFAQLLLLFQLYHWCSLDTLEDQLLMMHKQATTSGLTLCWSYFDRHFYGPQPSPNVLSDLSRMLVTCLCSSRESQVCQRQWYTASWGRIPSTEIGLLWLPRAKKDFSRSFPLLEQLRMSANLLAIFINSSCTNSKRMFFAASLILLGEIVEAWKNDPSCVVYCSRLSSRPAPCCREPLLDWSCTRASIQVRKWVLVRTVAPQ